jgi:hypothetical protein
MVNPYTPPGAQLQREVLNTEGQGTLQGGINGQYDFSIGGIIAEGWEKTHGAKGTLLLALLIYIVIASVLNVVQGLIFPNPNVLMQQGQFGTAILWITVTTLISIPLTYPLVAGITLLGIRRSVDAKIEASSIFQAYSKTIPLTLLYLALMLMTLLGYALLIIPGIYLSVAYLMSYSLMIDRNIGIWEALEASRKAITKHWFKIFFLYLTMAVMCLLASLPLLIGLIWMLPLFFIVHGILYKKMFGVASVQ